VGVVPRIGAFHYPALRGRRRGRGFPFRAISGIDSRSFL
jgi:hypothetical protein